MIRSRIISCPSWYVVHLWLREDINSDMFFTHWSSDVFAFNPAFGVLVFHKKDETVIFFFLWKANGVQKLIPSDIEWEEASPFIVLWLLHDFLSCSIPIFLALNFNKLGDHFSSLFYKGITNAMRSCRLWSFYRIFFDQVRWAHCPRDRWQWSCLSEKWHVIFLRWFVRCPTSYCIYYIISRSAKFPSTSKVVSLRRALSWYAVLPRLTELPCHHGDRPSTTAKSRKRPSTDNTDTNSDYPAMSDEESYETDDHDKWKTIERDRKSVV